jgi:hypothetical protein
MVFFVVYFISSPYNNLHHNEWKWQKGLKASDGNILFNNCKKDY